MSDLNLRDIPEEMMRSLKVDAAASGKTLRELCMERLVPDGGKEWIPVTVRGERMQEPVKRAKKTGAEQNFPRVARGGVVAQSIVDKDFVDAEFDPPIRSVVARPRKSAVGEELNSGDALAAYGVGGHIAPVYGGIKRNGCAACGGLNGLHQKGCKGSK